jgi:dihydroorotate dehydrogenase
VQVGTANFNDPGVAERLVIDLVAWCRERGIGDVNDLVGTLDDSSGPGKETGREGSA